MSFIGNVEQGKVHAAGWFLAHEECERKTREVTQAMASTRADGAKYVPMGTFFPANSSSTVEGIVYEDVDVTSGNMPASVVLKGVVYLDRLPAAPESGVQSALEGKGFTFIAHAPKAIRPEYPTSLKTLTVASAAGTAVGDTAITVSGYTPRSTDGYKYKVADTAPAVSAGEVLGNGWTAWNGTDDITAATDKKITVAVVNEFGEAIAAGSATVTAKA